MRIAAVAALLILAVTPVSLAEAATSTALLPSSEGTYLAWTPTSGTTHFTMVDETTCNGTTDYNSTTTAGSRDSYGVSLATVPDGSTITRIDITPCASRNQSSKGGSSTLKVFYRLNGVNSADAGNYALAGTTPTNLGTTTFSGLSTVKQAGTTLQIGSVLSAGTRGARLGRIAAVITYTPPAPPPDTTPPSVTLTAPLGGATVSGASTSVAAAASDDVGVVGVQFKLDGVNLGGEDTAAPYTITWNTMTVTNGPHTLVAVARDARGNSTTSTPVSVTVANAPVPGLALGWGFDENAGTTTADASGAGRTGALVNGPLWAAGKYGRGLSFDGANDHVAGPSHTLTSPFTVMAWINNPTNSAYETVLSVGEFRDFFVSNANVSFWDGARETGFGAVGTGAWHHLAWAYDGTSLRAYVDGVQIGSPLTTSLGAYTGIIRSGAVTLTNGTVTDYFSGSLDEVRIYARTLSPSEIQAAMNNALVPPPPDITPPTVSLTAPAPGSEVSGGGTLVSAAAADDIAVSGVQFKLDGVNLGAEDTAPPYSIVWNTTTVTNGAHVLVAVARDAAGNTAASAEVVVTVNNAPDTTPPSVPASVTATPMSPSQINLAWAASSDDTGVLGYKVFRNGTLVATPAGTAFADLGLPANTTYAYTVAAFDGAGNTSPESAATSATTLMAFAPTLPSTFETGLPAVTGSTFTVGAGGSVQAAIDAAAAADPDATHEVVIEAGAVFSGALVVPPRAAGAGWILVRSAHEAALPSPGTRVGLANAPDMPRLQATGSGGNATPVIDIRPGARQWRFIGLEVTVANGAPQYSLIRVGSGAETAVAQLATDIVFDRLYLHSFSTALSSPLKFGIIMNGARVALLDSYLDDFKAAPAQITAGDDGESKALVAWNSSGPFKIVNNFMQAAGVNVMFGGSDANAPALRPADLEFRNNYVRKNAALWRSSSVVAKTTFELKNMQRALIQGNRFELAWYPVSGDGGQLLRLNVRNQDNTDPGSRVQDITFRNNVVSSGTLGIQFLVHDSPNASSNMARVLTENNVFADISAATWGGGFGSGWTFSSFSPGAPPPNNAEAMVFRHNTVFSDISAINTFDSTNQVFASPVAPSAFESNIFVHGLYGIRSDQFGEGTTVIDGRFGGAPFIRNIMIGGHAPIYPPDNFFPATIADVGFVNYAGGDYRLSPASLYKNAGTDGADVGANIDVLEAATACVVSGLCAP